MRKIFVLFLLIVISAFVKGQDQLGFPVYEWDEVKNADADTIYGVTFEKLKLEHVPDQLSQFKNIQYINLNKNKLSKIPDFFGDFSNLKILKVEKNQLEYFPIQVCRMQNLRSLHIGKNHFNRIPECIENAKSIEFIDLYDTPVEFLPNSLSKLENLKKIDFTGIRFSPSFQAYWLNLLKDVDLVFDVPCDCMEN